MIAALNAFSAGEVTEADYYALYAITRGFESLPDGHRVIPAMFDVMERFPEELGAACPLRHCIEGFDLATYEHVLISSVQRQPGEVNVLMVNAILNTELTPSHRESLLAVLRSVSDHPSASGSAKELAANMLAYQTNR